MYSYICNGQGDQYKGMGINLLKNNTFYKKIEYYDSLIDSVDLFYLLREASDVELKKTENAQIVTYAMSVAIGEIVKELLPDPEYYAGLSLGEYTALTLAGVMSIEQGLPLIYKRGLLMGQFKASHMCMYAVIGMDADNIRSILKSVPDMSICMDIANYNSDRQTVISGYAKDQEFLRDLFFSKGAMDMISLNVSGPFHTEFYRPISNKFKLELDRISWNKTAEIQKVLKNLTSTPYSSKDNIAKTLSDHMCKPVLWKQSIQYMKNHNISDYIELGPGSTLKKLNRDISKKSIKTYITNSTENIKNLKESFVIEA